MYEFLVITFIGLLATMSPGPDFIIVFRNSLVFSRKIGICTAIGIALGVTIHVTFSLIGIGLIITKSIVLFNIIKFAGAMYLMYLGLGMLFSKSSELKQEKYEKPKKHMSNWQAVKIGFLTNVLNPKAAIFFLGLFSQIISPETGIGIKVFYGAEMLAICFLWFTFWFSNPDCPDFYFYFIIIPCMVGSEEKSISGLSNHDRYCLNSAWCVGNEELCPI